jgi:anti-sigma factor RsiW
MRVCGWFDQYRDELLSPARRVRFEEHLPGCPDCRSRMMLLNNLVHALKINPPGIPDGFAERTARRAFRPETQTRSSWDSLVVSWVGPVPALITLFAALLVFSSFWLIPHSTPTESVGEYETLLNESYNLTSNGTPVSARSDDELFRVLIEGRTQ